VFALREINLSKLESRPLRGRPWEYLFYIEIDARAEDEACAEAIAQLGDFAQMLRVLGTYTGAERKWAK
jgi:prephenate dehydratase